MKTVVMTGATSFLGRNVLNGLLHEEVKIFALVRESSTMLEQLPRDEKVTYMYGTLDELNKILDVVEYADYFIHFAWDGSGNFGRSNGEIQKKNVEYSKEALKISFELGCEKFIFPGSQAEYGVILSQIKEEEKCNPVSEYGKAKLAFSEIGQRYCENKTLQFIHLRIFSVYGPGDREGTLVDACVKKFNNGGHMKLGPCLQKWNYLYISDFVNALIKILKHDCKSGIYNIAGSDTRVMREFVKEIYALSNKTGSYEFGETATNPEGSPSLDPDITKIRTVVNWSPMVGFAEGIRRIMKNI